ncbi:hypothetical protein [Winogradskyella ursingii]|uniref:hypothetical protein n=1 Tax=Winogradskyella ursingii TaxID=2686079 RepID=UPI0015CDD561|nr:hypothetical protein [Winogradskyella ursingii]
MNIKTLLIGTFKVTAFVLAMAVLAPSAVKLSHVFTHHTHEVCEDDNEHSTHFHQTDLECEFYKFKLTKIQYLELKNDGANILPLGYILNSWYYNSFYSHQQLHTFLRGPPILA